MYDRTCAECGAPFVAKKWNGKYCTPLCHSRAHEKRRPARGPNRRGRVTKSCDWCGRDFESKRSNHAACCSRTCARHLGYNDQSSSIPWAECGWCGHRFINRTGRKYCSQRCLDMNHPWRPRAVVIRYGVCSRCGRPFIYPAYRPRGYCTSACAKRARKNHRKHLHRTATRTGESVTIPYLGARDHWICQLCGRRVDRTKMVPHPKAPTIDHIVPVSQDGEHSRANTQLAHFDCNIRKQASPAGEQLRLIG